MSVSVRGSSRHSGADATAVAPSALAESEQALTLTSLVWNSRRSVSTLSPGATVTWTSKLGLPCAVPGNFHLSASALTKLSCRSSREDKQQTTSRSIGTTIWLPRDGPPRVVTQFVAVANLKILSTVWRSSTYLRHDQRHKLINRFSGRGKDRSCFH